MTEKNHARRRRTGLIALVAALALAVAGIFVSAAPAFADSTFGLSPAPQLFSDGSVGDTITVFSSNWDPTPDSFSYQWYSNDVAISGASGTTTDVDDLSYTPVSADLGNRITLTVIAHKTGYVDTPETSDPTAPLGAPHVTAGNVTISGSTTLGSTLTVDPGTWGPGAVALTYQWYRNGEYLSGEESQTYVTTGRDSGQYISVVVTGTESGYLTTTDSTGGYGPISGTVLTISGTVTGQPVGGGAVGGLGGIFVQAFQGTDGTRLGYDYTQNDGTYSISLGAVSDSTGYTVEFNYADYTGQYTSTQSQYVYEYLGGAVDVNDASTFSLTTANPSYVANDELALGATVSGTIKDSSGNPLSGAYVTAGPTGQYNGPQADSNSDGTYTLHQVSVVDNVVKASAYPNFGGDDHNLPYYNTQYWDHAATLTSATALTITPGQPITGINFDVTPEATVTGRVVDSSGAGVPYMDYVPWHYDPAHDDYVSPREGPFITDSQGYFTLPANGYQGYKLEFFDTMGASGGYTVGRTVPYNTTWYGGTGTIGTATAVTFTGPSDNEEIGNVVVTPNSGTLSWTGAPQIDPLEDDATFVEVDGAVPNPGTASVAYQWYRDGVAIPGATDGDYQLTSDDTGHILTATLTASLDGYTDAVVTTPGYDLRQTFAVTTAPTLTGTAQVGNSLTVTDPVSSPAPSSVSYQWYRQVGSGTPTIISGAASSAYALTPADFGDTISVVVTLSKVGYHDDPITLTTSSTVAGATLTQGIPVISDTTPTYGDAALSVDEGTWGPGTVNFTYQWLLDGTTISGANAKTYALKTTDVGHQLSVTVTGSETGYTTASVTSAKTTAVVGGTITAPTATISDPTHTTPTFGDVLTGTQGTWTPSGVTLTNQWLDNGATIAGANGLTYTVVAGDIGQKISFRVTGTKAGYVTASQTSAQTATVVKATFVENTRPSITGPSAANKYTAVAGSWSPTPSLTTYQWSANGTPIALNGTSSTYTAVAGDAGKTLSVLVTVSQSGYTTASDSPAQPTAAVVGQFSSKPVPTLSGTAKVGSTLTATPGAWVPTPDSISYTFVGYGSTSTCGSGTMLQTGTSATYVIAASAAGETVCVRQSDVLANFEQDATAGSSGLGPVANGTLATGTPTISGTTTFGNSLTVSPGTWSPSGESFTYKWYRTVGVGSPTLITTTTSTSYALQTADVGATLTVTATGSLAGYDTVTSASSDSTAQIAGEAFTSTGKPAISPLSATNGSTLTAIPGTWSPDPGASGFTYQWYQGDTVISGATSKTYIVTSGDVGQPISVIVTGHSSGFAATPEQSDSLVPTAAWTTIPTATITGTAKVGSTVTAHAGTWVPTADGVTYSYVWTYGSSTLTATDPSASSTNDFVIPAAALGHTIGVIVTAHAPGYQSTPSVASTKTAAVTSGALTTVVPTVSYEGTLAVGNTLTANPGDWAPGSATFKYQWYKGSTAISGATKSTYVPTSSVIGSTVKVKITGSATGYTSASATSVATAKVVAGTIIPGTANIVGAATYGTKLTIDKGTWGPGTLTFTYKWYRDGTAISGATSSSYTIGSSSIGHVISVKVTAARSGFTSEHITSDPTDTIVAATFASAPVPTITGTLAVGSTLTEAHATSSPSTSVTKKYQWYRESPGGDPVAISGATSTTRVLSASDAGHIILVKITYSLSGYTPVTQYSTVTTAVWVRGTPKITGTAKVGDLLTASTGTWTPSAEVTYTYQWYRSGVAITDATESTYTLTSSDKTKTMTVKVIATDTTPDTAYAPSTSSASSATAKVAA